MASESVKVGVVEEICHDGNEVEEGISVSSGGTEMVVWWDIWAMGENGVNVLKECVEGV